jgi:hypothetical protein
VEFFTAPDVTIRAAITAGLLLSDRSRPALLAAALTQPTDRRRPPRIVSTSLAATLGLPGVTT